MDKPAKTEKTLILKAVPLADLIVQVMEQPGHQMVDEIDVHAMGQEY